MNKEQFQKVLGFVVRFEPDIFTFFKLVYMALMVLNVLCTGLMQHILKNPHPTLLTQKIPPIHLFDLYYYFYAPAMTC